MLGLGLALTNFGTKGGVSDSADGGAFTPLSLSPFAWWRVVPGSIWQDTAGTTAATADGDPVGRVDDLSGNTRHLLQSTAAARPVLRTSGGKYWLEFDGVDDRLRVTWSSTPQPITRIGSLYQISWTANDRCWDGGAGNESSLFQNVSSPNLSLVNPSGSNLSNEVLSDWMVVTERMYGAGVLSSVAVDNNAYVTMLAGWAATAQTGFTVAAFGTGTASFANIRWSGHFFKDATMTDENIALLRTYLGADVGKVL